MKKLFFCFFTCLFSIYGVTQEENPPYGTTLEEYNYVTKGYATQVDLGLDIKAGYELLDLGNYGITTVDNWEINIQLKTLRNSSMRDNSNNFGGPYDETNRATMVIITTSNINYKLYLCIPNYYSSQELWDKYFEEIKRFNKNYLLALTWTLSKSRPEMNFEAIYAKSIPDKSTFGTSLKEYNYVTKGYATQIEHGLDILKGYSLYDQPNFGINTSDEGEINIEIKELYKEIYSDSSGGSASTVKATMLIINSSQYLNKKYLCIPNSKVYSNPDLWNMYFDEINNLNNNYLLALSWSLSHYLNL